MQRTSRREEATRHALRTAEELNLLRVWSMLVHRSHQLVNIITFVDRFMSCLL